MTRFAGTELSQYMSDMPDFTGLSKTMLQGTGIQQRAADSAVGKSALAGIGSAAAVKGAGFKADAIRAQGAAEGQAAMASGIGGLFSGLAGGIGSMGGGGSSYNSNYGGAYNIGLGAHGFS